MFKKKKDNELKDLQEIKPKKKKNKKVVKRVIIGGVIVAILALFILPKVFAPEVLPTVKTDKAHIGDVEQVLSTSGFVASEETKTYYSDVSAKITEFNIEKGSVIHAGDVLVSYDTQALENATKYQNASTDVGVLEQQVEDQQNYVESLQMDINDETNYAKDVTTDLADAQAKLEEATKANNTSKIDKYNKKINDIQDKIDSSENYSTDLSNKLISAQNELATLQSNLSEQKSIKSSSEEGVLTGNEKTQKSATSEVTTLTLEQAQANLDKARAGINADFNGIITDVQVAEGATVAEGAALFTIASNEDVKLTVALSKYDLENVKEGQSADITLGASTYTGTVSKISRVATTNSAGTAVINAEIHIDNPDDNIYLGVEAKVKINVGSASSVVLVPGECVNTDKDGEFLYVIENGVVVKKAVTTGLSSDEYIEIKDGVKDGDEVISEITADIKEGMKVTAVAAKADSNGAAATTTDSTEATKENTDSTQTTSDTTKDNTDSKESKEATDATGTDNAADKTEADKAPQE
jgi:RND family efflux transporter MFP subunit